MKIYMTRKTTVKMRNIWSSKKISTIVHIHMKIIRLYKDHDLLVYYGSEVWKLDKDTVKRINRTNNRMMTTITGRNQYE